MLIKNSTLIRALYTPYYLFMKIRNNNETKIMVDLAKLGINSHFEFFLSPEDKGLSNQMRSFGFREPLNSIYFLRFLDDNDRMLDIGANIGYFTLLGFRVKKIVAVEPLQELIPVLKKNIDINNLSDKCVVINAAVGPKGKLLMNNCEKKNLSRIVASPTGDAIEVEGIPLFELTDRYTINFLRMDVEGFEYEILLNQIPDSIDKISMEFHAELLGKEKSMELLAYFREKNFTVKYLIDDIPMILYPLVFIFKNLIPFKYFSSVKQDLSIDECISSILDGRAIKHLFLVRMPNL